MRVYFLLKQDVWGHLIILFMENKTDWGRAERRDCGGFEHGFPGGSCFQGSSSFMGFLKTIVHGISWVRASEVKHKAGCREQHTNTAGSGPPMLMRATAETKVCTNCENLFILQ